jgi:hypothetical protein
MMRRQADWTMSMSPGDLAPSSFTALVEGAGWTAATTNYQVFVRADGQWNEIARLERGQIAYASGGGRKLFVATSGGGVFQYEVDAGTWQDLTPALTGVSRGLWGDLRGLYLRYSYGSSVEMTRFDGASWTRIPPPAFQGYSDVAGLSADEVYAIAASRLYRVDGGSAIEVPAISCGGTPIYQSLSAAPGQLIVELSCAGQHQLWRREMDDWAFVAALPQTLPGPLRVSSNGQVYVGGSGVYRVLSDGLESLEESPRPPVRALGGTSKSSLFAGGDEGVAQLVDDAWQLLPDSPRFVMDLWQAPSGDLFATTLDANGNALWKYDGSGWTELLTDSNPRVARVYGRSESDYYYWRQRSVQHWDGATWTQLPEIPCEGQTSAVLKFALAGSDIVLAHCIQRSETLFEFTGTSWVDLVRGFRRLDIFQAGPVESPVTYFFDNGVYHARSQSGWDQFSLPGGYLGLGTTFTSVDGSRFIAKGDRSFATTDGTEPWSVVSEWVTGGLSAGLLWTDGRFAGSTQSNSIVVCDLGSTEP